MNTNINTDNYEAYLLDYMEGNLSPDKAEQLKAFVAAQGLNWDELTEELPHLEVPVITYDGKDNLKKKGAVVPLYAKIASVAAAAGLLLTVTLWPENKSPKVGTIAELKPILPTRFITLKGNHSLPPRTVSFDKSQTSVNSQPKAKRSEATLLADLQPVNAEGTQIAIPSTMPQEPNFDLIAYRMNAEFAFAQNDDNLATYAENTEDLSLVNRGVFKLTGGNHNSFTDLLLSGIHTAKQEVNLAAADFAMTAYYRVDDRIEEAKERWEERREP